MIKQKELVPKRRFEGLNEKWEERSFDTEIELYSGLTYSPNDVKPSGTFVLRSSNVQNGEIVQADNVYVNPEVVNSSNVREGDIIVVVRNGSRSLIGKHAKIKTRMDKTVIGAFMTGIRSNEPSFINALLDTQNFKDEIDKNLGATINQITNGMFKSMNFFFPKIEEQQKIGQFFKHLDEMITLEQRKIDKTNALKSAYLAEMFPAEGERVPKRRFEEFKDEWDQFKLGKLGSVAMNKRIFKDQTSDKGDIPFYKIGTFGKEPDAFISRRLFEEYKANYEYPKIGDILISASGSIGRTVEYTGEDEYFQDSNIVWLKHDGKLNNLFLKQFYEIVCWEGLEGSTIKRLYNKNILNTQINVPSLKEQGKIGLFFNKIDDTILNQQQKLDKLKATKQAYLHEMFV